MKYPFAVAAVGCALLLASAPSTAAETRASLAQDDAQQTKYDVILKNTGSSTLSGFAARIYFDISEILATGRNATHLRCDERYDPSGAASCAVTQYSGNVYYASLSFGSYSLSPGASVTYKITLRLSDWSNNWSSTNDYSRVGLGSAATVTARIPIYQGATRIYGTDPDGSPPQTVAAPTFTPPPGTYATAQTVSIATTTGSATIRYTTGNTNPTCSSGTIYSSPLLLSSSTTLRAIGCASGLADSPVTVGTYTIKFNIPGSAVTASAHDGNVPANTVDGNLATRWSASGDGQWIQYDIGSTVTVSSVGIAWYNGDAQASLFEIQSSNDGAAFVTRFSGQSSGTSNALEAYDFADVNARYIRILGHGNTQNAWNSITETQIWGSLGGSCSGALSSALAIQNAMRNATPGAVIRIAPGTYTGDRATSGDPRLAGDGRPTGVFYSGNNGSASNRIVLRGCDPGNPPVLRGTSNRDGSYGIHLTGDYWEIRDLIVQDAQKGIMLDNANRGLISNVVVHDVGDEAVHFRDGSSNNVIEHSRIYNTGRYQGGYGEGVYVGSDGGTSTYQHTVVDNVIRYVNFDGGITAEHIDVKEGATGTIIEYSTFNGTGISGANSADSFVDIKGVNSTVRHNTGRRNGNANVVDAFQVRTHSSCCPTGTNNRFHDNAVHLDGIGTPGSTSGYVVFATSQTAGTTSSNDSRSDGNTTNIYNRNVNR